VDGEKDVAERAKELFVYGPIGLALYLRDTAPSFLKVFVSRGRTEFDQRRRVVGDHLDHARSVGESATLAGGPQVLKLVGDGLSQLREKAEEALGRINQSANAPVPTSWSADAAPAPEDGRPAPRGVPRLAIADYDDLSASQIVDRLEGLAAEDLQAIAAYEAANRARNTILTKIDQLAGGA
jgi:hypothetical protein